MDLPNTQTEYREPAAQVRLSRMFQLLIACASLIAAFVPAILTAGAVWFTLGRPLLFDQTRSGLHGRPFKIYKFRTMHDRRDDDGNLLPDSDRQTAITRFLRTVRLDEIPQLLAIVAGDLNFIGPRPLQPRTIAAFGTAGLLRGRVRPGLTGWAQVNGNTRLSDTEKFALDLWYIDNRSVWLDLRILLLTVHMIVFGESVNQHNVSQAKDHVRQRLGVTLSPGPGASGLSS